MQSMAIELLRGINHMYRHDLEYLFCTLRLGKEQLAYRFTLCTGSDIISEIQHMLH